MEKHGFTTEGTVEEAPRYPELVNRLDTLTRLSNRILTRWLLGRDGAKEVLSEAKSVAYTGGVELDLGEHEDRPEGLYKLELNKNEASRLFDAMEEYLRNPYQYHTPADTMGDDLEDLMSGTGPTEKYVLVSSSQE